MKQTRSPTGERSACRTSFHARSVYTPVGVLCQRERENNIRPKMSHAKRPNCIENSLYCGCKEDLQPLFCELSVEMKCVRRLI